MCELGRKNGNFPSLVGPNKSSWLSIMPRFFIHSARDSWPTHISLSRLPTRNSVVSAEIIFIQHHTFGLLPPPPPASIPLWARESLRRRHCESFCRSLTELSPSLLPDSEIVIINQKTTACQPERARTAHTEKKCFSSIEKYTNSVNQENEREKN